VDAFWHLNYYMIFDEREFSKASEAAWDLRELPGWGAADSMTRARIVEAAERYVFEGDPRTDEWLEKGSPHRPALAGYRAPIAIKPLTGFRFRAADRDLGEVDSRYP
jgi:hypothetical protein